MPEGVPLQSLSRLPGWPTVWRSTPASRGSLALQRRPSTGPRERQTIRVCHGSDPGVSHPLAGFLARSSLRVCFTPLPSLGSRLPSERSPRDTGRAPLVGAAGSLVVLPGRTPVRRARSCHLWPSPTRATFGRRPWPDPAEARGSLSTPLLASTTPTLRRRRQTRLATRPGHPGPRTPDSPRSGRSVDFEAFFPARIRSHLAAVARRAVAGALLGVLAPPEPCSRQTWGPRFTRHGRRRPSSRWHRAPLGASCDLQDSRASVHVPGSVTSQERLGAGNPRRRVGSNGDDRIVPLDPSADTGSLRPGPCRPSAAASTPMTFDVRCARAPAHVSVVAT
jgi:hypothetical protein